MATNYTRILQNEILSGQCFQPSKLIVSNKIEITILENVNLTIYPHSLRANPLIQ